MDTVSCQQVRRFAVATVPPRRPPDQAAAAAFRAGWYGRSSGCLSISTPRRTPSFLAATDVAGAGQHVARGRGPSTLPARRPYHANSDEAPQNTQPCDADHSEMAQAGMVLGGTPDGVEGDRAPQHIARSLGCSENNQLELESITARDEHMRMEVLAASRLRRGQTSSTAIDRSARLLEDFGWSVRTGRSRDTQWRTYLDFCATDNRDPLPITEAHLAAYIGWITEEKEAGRRNISHSSLRQYISAIRQRQSTVLGIEVPPFPFIGHLLRAYQRWEEATHPQPTVRCGLPASAMQQIWELGMSSCSIRTVRDAAMCLFAYSFNGLRESSVCSLRATACEFSDRQLTCRLHVVKRRQASTISLVRFTATLSPSPLDLWARWNRIRSSHSRFFALADEPREWVPQSLSAALRRCLSALNINPPRGGKYSSHSLRIGAHTEQVLLGIPLEIRLSRFGWGPNSAAMAQTYFDGTLVSSAASVWIFGAGSGLPGFQSTPGTASTPTS